MTVYVINKDIYLRQGDTGQVTFSNLPKDQNYSVYLSVYDPDTDAIIDEVSASVFTQSTGVALFLFDEDFSNNLPVGDWVYGLKICHDGTEDTLIPLTRVENNTLVKHNPPKFTVDYKYVEGDLLNTIRLNLLPITNMLRGNNGK